MTKVAFRTGIPFFDRDTFLTPFDKMFDSMVESQFPEVVKSVGVKPYQGSAYPKVNVYEYDDKEKLEFLPSLRILEPNNLTWKVDDQIINLLVDILSEKRQGKPK